MSILVLNAYHKTLWADSLHYQLWPEHVQLADFLRGIVVRSSSISGHPYENFPTMPYCKFSMAFIVATSDSDHFKYGSLCNNVICFIEIEGKSPLGPVVALFKVFGFNSLEKSKFETV